MQPLVKIGAPPAKDVKLVKTVPSLGPKKDVLPVWTSTGVREKPEACKLCPFRTAGSGFVPDFYPDEHAPPSLGFLLSHPGSDDVVEQRPWAGRAGYAWEKLYLKPFGLSLSQVFVGHVLRCQPKERRFGRPQYPTGSLKRGAEIQCRRHDGVCWGGKELRAGGIHALNPNLFVTTFHPSDALAVPAYTRLIHHDVEKAVKKVREGYRVLVLMGDEAREIVAPWATRGGSKSWRGNWWHGSWPYLEESSLLVPGFIEV